MSIYDDLRIAPVGPCTRATLEAALARLTPEAVAEDFRSRGWGPPPRGLVRAMRAQLLAAATVVASPRARDIYDAWRAGKPGVAQRMEWYNRRVACLFAEEACAGGGEKMDITSPPAPAAARGTVCRWCATDFTMEDMAIYQCRCGGWAGHRACGQAFASEYAKRCPICRTKLLPRERPSKFMFWSVDLKWKF